MLCIICMGCAPFTYDPFTYHPFYLQVVGKRVGHHYWSSISQTDLNDPVSNSCNFLEFGQRIKLSFNDKQGGPLLVPKVKDWTLPSYKIYQNIKHEAVNLSTLCQASLKGAQYIKEKLGGPKQIDPKFTGQPHLDIYL